MKVEVNVKTQYPWNHKVPVELLIWLDDSADRLEIVPRSSGVGAVVIRPERKVIYSPEGGKRYTVTFGIYPQSGGDVRISFAVISNRGGTLEAANAETILRFTESLELSPVTNEYRILKNTYLVSLGIIITLGILGLLYLSKRLLRWFQGWLRAQERKPV